MEKGLLYSQADTKEICPLYPDLIKKRLCLFRDLVYCRSIQCVLGAGCFNSRRIPFPAIDPDIADPEW